MTPFSLKTVITQNVQLLKIIVALAKITVATSSFDIV